MARCIIAFRTGGNLMHRLLPCPAGSWLGGKGIVPGALGSACSRTSGQRRLYHLCIRSSVIYQFHPNPSDIAGHMIIFFEASFATASFREPTSPQRRTESRSHPRSHRRNQPRFRSFSTSMDPFSCKSDFAINPRVCVLVFRRKIDSRSATAKLYLRSCHFASLQTYDGH